MNYRILGRTGIQVSEIGFGAWAIGGDTWGSQDDKDSIAALNKALDLGCNFFDTALSYGSGHSEHLVRRVIKDRGQHVVVATKIPPKNDLWGPPPYQSMDEEYPPEWIIACCERSLQNLGLETIDVLLFHTWNMSWSHQTEWYEAIVKLKQQGKIRANGISVGDQRSSEANVHIEAGRVDVVEVVYNIFEQLPKYDLFPLAEKHHVGIIARSPLQAGVLTGRINQNTTFAKGDWRKEWVPAGWLTDNVTMLGKVLPVIQKTGMSLVKVALGFCLSNSIVGTVIPGMRNIQQVEQNLMESSSQRLPEETMMAFDELWKKGEIHGTYTGSS